MLAGLVIVFFLTLLILAESADWGEKLRTVAQPRTEWRLTESAEVIAGKVRTYLLVRTVLGLATAALYALWLWLFGVELIFVWALLTFLLSFVPVVGSLIAGLLPVTFALVMQDWGTALMVGAGILVIEQVMGNYVEPKLEGDHIAVSPLVVLMSLLFWSWIWGIPGALLAVPATASLAVLGAHVPALRSWALLLTNRTTMRGLREVTRLK
jgi:AI-2 transport protein TqsA